MFQNLEKMLPTSLKSRQKSTPSNRIKYINMIDSNKNDHDQTLIQCYRPKEMKHDQQFSVAAFLSELREVKIPQCDVQWVPKKPVSRGFLERPVTVRPKVEIIKTVKAEVSHQGNLIKLFY